MRRENSIIFTDAPDVSRKSVYPEAEEGLPLHAGSAETSLLKKAEVVIYVWIYYYQQGGNEI